LPDAFFSNQKSPIWVNFEGHWNGQCWYVFCHFENFTAIWYTLWTIGNLVVIWYIDFPVLVYCVWSGQIPAI
jgi:hypothetical protein